MKRVDLFRWCGEAVREDGGDDVGDASEGGGVAEVKRSVNLESFAENHDGVDVSVKECLGFVA